jgi:hypothetical protein
MASVDIGNQASIASPRVTPQNAAAATPTIATGFVFTITTRPRMAGSPAKRRCQSRWMITAAGARARVAILFWHEAAADRHRRCEHRERARRDQLSLDTFRGARVARYSADLHRISLIRQRAEPSRSSTP